MTIYVSELPKNCAKCELCSHIFTNCLPELYKCAVDGHARFADYKVEDEEPCPLQSLAEHDKQVIKEMVEKIKWLARAKGIFGQNCKVMNYIQFNDILDQIQGDKIE